ncbi:MAG: cysteine--tRNA ligase [Acidobacteria bacterium]|nr:MAG: cysteine--tRNA ligase [Acidobacteriota bacterium]
MMLKLTNTLTGNLEPFSPDNGNTVRMYTCGPTVYDFAHIGNLRTFVFEDILRRHLRGKGWTLKHVMNITDIDDKIINKAIEAGQDIKTYTAPYTEAFFKDCETLRIERPDIVTPATDYIPEMIDLVGRLIQSGYAYPEGESIYYRISRFPSYGRLSRLEKRELKLGARIDVDEYEKEEPRDFVLWKAPKHEKEPRWEAPFGTGRPGWHIECSAMAMKQLGETLDIHCGGVDNIFPHHENEIAQSEAVTGKPFARFWIHGEHLLVEGEKMAKSKGNFYTLRDLIDRGYDPLAIRYLLVSVPYRKQLNFTFEGLDAARSSLDRIKEFLFRLKSSKFKPGRNPAISAVLTTARKQLDAALDDDLNTAQALAAVFGLIKEGNIALTEDALEEENRSEILQWFEVVEQRLGIVPTVEALVQVDEKVGSLIAQRNEARRNRDFAKADRIRQELLDLDVIIEDTREGTKWRRK